MINTLLISSLSELYYYKSFIEDCKKVGVNIGVLDPEFFIKEKMKINIEHGAGCLTGTIDVLKIEDDSFQIQNVSIENIKVAWYLRVNRTQRVADIEDVEERFIWNETLTSLDIFFSLLPCPWINSYESIERLLCNKLLQEIKASEVGFKTPTTVISNVHQSLTTFCAKSNCELILKTMGYTKLGPDESDVLYSEKFDLFELEQSKDAVSVCPVYSQEYIQKKYEYRVMVIGDGILACRIDSQASAKTKIDWRHYDFENVEHISVVLPANIQAQLKSFMHSVNLRYGAIDLIETPEGEFVFLEVNPSGQWEWISVLADLRVSESVAKMLRSYL